MPMRPSCRTPYDDRRQELKRQGLLQVAARLAAAFHNGQPLREHELDAALETGKVACHIG